MSREKSGPLDIRTPSEPDNFFTKFKDKNLRNLNLSLTKLDNLTVSEYADARHIFFYSFGGI